jgi:hypothetical protein
MIAMLNHLANGSHSGRQKQLAKLAEIIALVIGKRCEEVRPLPGAS